ncbi:MAG: hypothetical protein RL291_1630, partial [Pseudomonadota bacterium]
ITGLDLVEWQLRVAAGEKLPKAQNEIKMQGHAIELRLCAEDPAQGFLPSIGRLDVVRFPQDHTGLRIETGVTHGSEVSPFYDSMISKIIATATTRDAALDRARAALDSTDILGLETNAAFLAKLLEHPATRSATMDTGLIGRELDALVARGDQDQAIAHVADLFLDSQHSSNTAISPWNRRDGFVLGAPRPIPVRLIVNGKPVDVSVVPSADGPTPSYKGKVGAWWDSENPDRQNIDTRTGETLHAIYGLTHYTVTWPTYDASAIDDGAGSGAVRAPINGRVAKVFVTEGAKVSKGDRIAIVEAMKMEHSLVAGVDGKVEKLAVTEGQQVAQNALVASIAAAA